MILVVVVVWLGMTVTCVAGDDGGIGGGGVAGDDGDIGGGESGDDSGIGCGGVAGDDGSLLVVVWLGCIRG